MNRMLITSLNLNQTGHNMEISFFDENAPLKFERVVLYPYPDLKRVWTRIWLTTVAEDKPNIEVVVLDPDGAENCSVYLMAHAEQRAETTLHMRNPVVGQTYPVVVELTRGLGDASSPLVDRGRPGQRRTCSTPAWSLLSLIHI